MGFQEGFQLPERVALFPDQLIATNQEIDRDKHGESLIRNEGPDLLQIHGRPARWNFSRANKNLPMRG